ncbi:MAG: nucleotide sugar dehydrogenase [Salinivirgaceae bacterium]|nr:MAG: nucleotide sugar dehydrogenase [Salinivirgaceae bacterium]
MYDDIIKGNKTISVIGLGYVGLPIALEFAKKTKVIGFDIKQDRVDLMKKGIDPSRELESKDFEGCDIEFTANPDDLKRAHFHIVAVPTPIDEHHLPDLKPLLSASETVGKILKKGDYVVFESTVYPGCTEEECIPVLEEQSGLKFASDFKIGFSPERINPGDREHTLTTIKKVVSGNDAEALENIAKIYEMVITAGIHRAPTIKVAEAAKIIENTQRDVNIALMNELSMIFNKLDINTFDVLEAAGTKWNFLKFFPGLVGGHCIGVDPYYLLHKAKESGYHPRMIDSGRSINDGMGAHVVKEVVKKLVKMDKNVKGSKVLIMGITFKEDVADIRNSKVVDLVNEFQSFGVNVDVIDEWADPKEVKEEYDIDLKAKAEGPYDVVCMAVQHKNYKNMSTEDLSNLGTEKSIFVDIKGIFKDKIDEQKFIYWSL